MLENVPQQEYNFQEFRKSTYTPQKVAFFSNKETTSTSYYEVLHEDDYKLQDLLFDPIAFSAAAEKDTMYYNPHPYLILMHTSKNETTTTTSYQSNNWSPNAGILCNRRNTTTLPRTDLTVILHPITITKNQHIMLILATHLLLIKQNPTEV